MAPAPFKERVPTFRVKVVEGSVFVDPRPNAPGTYVEPSRIESTGAAAKSDFYVGYLQKAPFALAQFVRRIVVMLAGLAFAVAIVLVAAQRPFDASTFEYGKLRTFEGVVAIHPYPTLLIARPGDTGDQDRSSQYLLVAPGKHGADELLAGFDRKQIRLQGQLIYRDGGTMVEFVPGSIVPTDTALASPQEVTRDFGVVTVTGEIVDSKCYLGVMNPAQGKVHRDCAARCLSGGIPPIFVTTSGHEQFLLVGPDGGALGHDSLREFIAEPISIRGELLRRGDTQLLRIEPKDLRHTPGL